MKKLLITTAVICSAALCGCGSADNTASSSSVQAVDVLQKSAEIRQQVQDAKTTAAAAQTANTNTSVGTSVKDAAKDYANSAAKPVVDEYNAWKDAVKK